MSTMNSCVNAGGSAVCISRRTLIKAALGTVAAGLCSNGFGWLTPTAAAGEYQNLNVMAWEGYDLTQQLKAWSEAQQVKIQPRPITVQDDVERALQQGEAIDVAEYNQAYADLYCSQLKLSSPLDAARLPHYSSDNLFPDFYEKSYWRVDGQLCGVPYIWGFNTILFNYFKVVKPTSYEDLLSPKLKGKVAIMDDTTGSWPVAARLSGFGDRYPLLTPQELTIAFAKMEKFLDNGAVLVTSQQQLLQLFASGDILAVLCADPSIISQLDEQGGTIDVALPKEGPVLWVDALFIPQTAPSADLAHQFLNQALSPPVQAQVATAVSQFPVSRRALKLMSVRARNRLRIDFSRLDEVLASGLPGIPPRGHDGIHASYAEWQAAWEQFKNKAAVTI
ncbi:PotD/PotF family extracellular solute-binding protein [Pseudomonas sp. MOB-449]|nr:PotD/PotF family extracellular solute-binding protein [Pseudomonas sp. MOB-449]